MGEQEQRCCPEAHGLAIARWEDNYAGWLEGNYLGLISKKPYLQRIVGQEGTLWIIVSRPRPGGGRSYSLSFRLNNCRIRTYRKETNFGQYAVLGDPSRSIVYASNDAKLLLLSLRFEPFNPIREQSVIGNSIQTPRCLNERDIRLLEEYAAATDRWSVFISYQHDDMHIAERLSNSLTRSGVNVFRDKEALRGGEQWWPALKHAIERCRYFVVVLGEETHRSTWVKREIQVALDNGVRLIPVLAGADLGNWKDKPELLNWHALSLRPDDWSSFTKQMLSAIGSPVITIDG